MFKTMNLHAEIPASRELRITLPKDVPMGPAELVLVIATTHVAQDRTLQDLANSEFFGMWKNRPSMGDDFARRLRSEGWKRSA